MKIYKVGGCVRDHLLGLEPKDIDYVVVGSSPAEMLSLGFQEVGQSFPVFLKDGEEYALARTERKTGAGYNGFAVEFDSTVTLEDDLIRRDLTINAMAMDMDTGEIIDPHGGQNDLRLGLLRHTSEAFAEDPVRVLRTARFAARYGFEVHPETIWLMGKIVPELWVVPQERIWVEFEKGLMERHPWEMVDVLYRCGAMESHGPLGSYSIVDREAMMRVLPEHDLAVRFGLVCGGFLKDEYEQCRIPADLAIIGYTTNIYTMPILDYMVMAKEDRLALLDRLRAFSRPGLVSKVLEIIALQHPDVLINGVVAHITSDILAAKAVDAAAIAASCKNGSEVKTRLFQARLAVM